jgi:hypothetical protein
MNLKSMKLGETQILASTGYDSYMKEHPDSKITKQEWEKSQKEKQEKAKK